jgi:flavin-dependent dehydrogenase
MRIARSAISTSLAAEVSDVMEEAVKQIAELPVLDWEATRAKWDAIVVGAGPAGALAARQFALAGLKTLLVDAKRFPREKVCGGYLNSRALEALRQAGLALVTTDAREPAVTQLEVIRGRLRTRFRLRPGRVICRRTFDAALIDAAAVAGAKVLTGAQAVVDPAVLGSTRRIIIVRDGGQESFHARVVISADGLSRTSVRHLPECAAFIAPNSRVGIGAIVSGGFQDCPAGQLTMVLSRHGYVGISRVKEQQFNVAAAMDRKALLRTPPAKIVADIMTYAGISFPVDLSSAHWRGTPPLTSRPKHVAAERVLLIGDAGGYIEPFTGEGMAFALESAIAITPLVVKAVQSWTPAVAANWEVLHQQMVRDRQRTCRRLAWILRRPWAASLTLGICRMMPGIAERMIHNTNDPISICRPARIGTT